MHYGGYAGHGSWIVGAIFFLTIALRIALGNRRRTGRAPRPPATAASLQPGRSGPPPAPAPSRPPAAEDRAPRRIGSSGVAAGWLVDPTGRHELRYWSGTGWTGHVSDGGVPAIDDPPDTSPPAGPTDTPAGGA